jgi:hypothetical protein
LPGVQDLLDIGVNFGFDVLVLSDVSIKRNIHVEYSSKDVRRAAFPSVRYHLAVGELAAQAWGGWLLVGQVENRDPRRIS